MDLRRILNDDNAPSPVAHKALDAAQGRVGKWSPEEERYAAALITYFMDGTLAVPAGTSLRSFLANKLRCSAMRISTKLSMDTLDNRAIPKRLGQKRFYPRRDVSYSERQSIDRERHDLEQAFFRVEKLEEEDQPTDDTLASTTSHEREDGAPQRIGSWSNEEQAYACALIGAFLSGHVELEEGVTLRAYLAERLCCNPMRVSKKLATGKVATTAIPKRLGSTMYHRQIFDTGRLAHAEYDLAQLRNRCFPATSGMESTHEVRRAASPVLTPPGRRVRLDESMEIDPPGAWGRSLADETAMKKRQLPPLRFPPSPMGLPSLLLDMHERVSTHR